MPEHYLGMGKWKLHLDQRCLERPFANQIFVPDGCHLRQKLRLTYFAQKLVLICWFA